MSYQFFHVRDNSSSNPLGLLSFLHERSRGNANWGIFPGLFGLGTNEAYWMFYGDDPGNHFGQSDHIVSPCKYRSRGRQNHGCAIGVTHRQSHRKGRGKAGSDGAWPVATHDETHTAEGGSSQRWKSTHVALAVCLHREAGASRPRRSLSAAPGAGGSGGGGGS